LRRTSHGFVVLSGGLLFSRGENHALETSALPVIAFILAGFSYLAAAGEGKDAAIKKDRKALQGLWKSSEDNRAGITSIHFDGDKVVVTFYLGLVLDWAGASQQRALVVRCEIGGNHDRTH
jgi:hypothetical protein